MPDWVFWDIKATLLGGGFFWSHMCLDESTN